MNRPIQLLTAVLLTASAGTAYADACETDEDCPTGFACEELGETCADSPPCVPGEECEEPEPCGESFSYECVPSPIACSSDTDCTDDWECFSFTYEECSGGGSTEPSPVPSEPGEEPDPDGDDTPGDPDEDTPDDHEPEPDGEWECESVTESYCAPPYVGECESDSECGEGFTCVEIEECSCGGSTGSGGSSDPTPVPGPGEDSGGDEPDGDEPDGDEPDGDEDEPDDHGDDDWDEDCECTGAGSFYCEPAEIDCESDTDCPADWSCEDWGVSVSTPCWEDEDGEVICDEEPAEETYSQCEPPGWGAWGGVGGDFDDARGATSASDSAEESGSLPYAATSDGEGAGCSSARGTAGGASLFALFGLLGFRRRRNSVI